MTEALPFGGELSLRLSWGPRGEGLDAVGAKLRATDAVVRRLHAPFGRSLAVVDPDGNALGTVPDLADTALVSALELGVARNEDGAPLPQDGYSVRLETAPGATLSGRVVGRFAATRSRFSAGNRLSVSVSQTFSDELIGTGFFAEDGGVGVLRELVAIWEPDTAGVFLAEAEDVFLDLELSIELGVVTYLAARDVSTSELVRTTESDGGTWIEVVGAATATGLDDLVGTIVRASGAVHRSRRR
ncbi:hypothetical protein [Curtobacterium sp. ER1/6]|uniref:hypothetical protein n=1 Tax=Curtobacterium sp. ER1/6 TaxID=1891920 RepID=UPI00084FA37D|nr:hypothetical protein [Curtobacterium sp. ER1/6]